ncbi:MAG: TonB-dependent receptor [Gammaproteobacteria bacterium]|nr:TonB-dependent receptor [Pseudomonadales bacterium]MCP5348478.1 TonB-dependent receptor [Pseudomonadales bacterium]
MNFKTRKCLSIAVSIALASMSGLARAQAEQEAAEVQEIVILGTARTYSNVTTTQSMQDQQNPITSVLATIDNLPGVNVTEGDTFGFDDWSTTINLRGYQTSLSDQQLGITIDGFPNGDSNYGGGAKANRYIDSMNSAGVDINQGIADISTRSTEALGGTLNFRTNDPQEVQRMRVQFSQGDYGSQRYYSRYDSGRILNDSSRLWVSFNHNEASDWMEGSAQNQRDHFAGKFISELNNFTLTGYYSWDDIHEDNYQRITLDEFNSDPDWDRLIGTWTDVAYVNQLYRRGWSTLRENNFGYLKLDADLFAGFSGSIGLYMHEMDGRGDWVPPYIANVSDEAGFSEYEIQGNLPVLGGSQVAGKSRLFFVDANGVALSPFDGCQSSITFPYGGAGPEFDPACYPDNAIPLQSYRHTNYARNRDGLTVDFQWDADLGGVANTLSGGLWYEDSTRKEWRTWHKLTDARVGIDFDQTPYWIQYSREFPRETTMWYLQDQLKLLEFITVSLGIREFDVKNKREDLFDSTQNLSLNSKSDTLFTGGASIETPVDGLEVFFGYAENIKPLLDLILEREISGSIEPETAENLELGLRYVGSNLTASAVLFNNEFSNRLEFFGPQLAGNIPNYEIGQAGRYDNVGGIESDGFELAGSYEFSDNWSLYLSYTDTNATYIGTGIPELDTQLDLTPGNTVVNTPDQMFVVSLDWMRGNYYAGLSTKKVGDRYMDRSNSLVASEYNTTDLYLNVRGEELASFLQGFDLGIVINNVFDESYLGGISGFGAWIGSPRTAVFTATFDF